MSALATMVEMKFTPLASIAEALDRQRLIALALEGAPSAARSTLIGAPAGYGKTTLLAQIRDHLLSRGSVVAWLNCTSEHGQPAILLGDVAASLRQAGLPVAMPEFGLTDIVKALAGSPGAALILDEFENASSDESDTLLELLIRMLPESAYLIVASRELSRMSLSKLLADGRTRIIRANDMQFTSAEVNALMSGMAASSLSPLVEQCHGWPVILQLMRLEMLSAGFPEGDIGLGASRSNAFRYLAEQVLTRQPPPLQEFLLQISLLTEVDASAAHAITGRDDAESVLRDVLHLSPIVTQIGDQPVTVRLHPLFRDFLCHEFTARHSGSVSALHRRAAEHYASLGRLSRAVYHAGLCGDNDFTAGILEHAGGALLVISEGIPAARNLLSSLPTALVNRRLELRLLRIMQQAMEGTGSEWLSDFERLRWSEESLVTVNYDGKLLADLIVAIRCAAETRYSPAKAPWGMISELRKKCLSLRYEEPRLLGVALPAEQIIACDFGSVDLAEQRMRELKILFEDEKYAPNAVWITNHLAFIASMRGMVVTAAEQSRIVLDRLDDIGEQRNTLMRRHCNALLAHSLFEQGQAELALAQLQTVSRKSAYSLLSTQVYASATRARCLHELGKPEEAIAGLDDDLAYALEEGLPHLSVILAATNAELRLTMGDEDGARRLIRASALEQVLEEHRTWFVRPWLETEALVRLFNRVWLAEGQVDRAYRLSQEFATRALQSGRILMSAYALVDAAGAAMALGQSDKVRSKFGQAAEASLVTGSSRLALSIDMILGAMGNGGAIGSSATCPRGEDDVGVARLATERDSVARTLSPRENAVMHELAEGHPTKIVARRLNLSYETVRHHMKNAYAKLGVHTRDDAVRSWLSVARHS